MPLATPASSTPLRPRADRMKDSILKESSAGWANAVTPLRIAKRDQLSPSSSSSPNPNSASGTRVIARRSSNSYKHMFNNNLVSRSPFKSQLTPRQPLGGGGAANAARSAQATPRKVSGDKRPRPDSLIQQAEQETAQRVTELGYKRRQSRGFQGLVEKGPVSKSPFLQFMSSGKGNNGDGTDGDERQHDDEENTSVPIAIEFPSKGEDMTSPETTETDSSLNSRESGPRPRTPPMRATPPRISPSPGFERRSPVPSALQGSPARSSLAQKSRLLGPRSRSLSTVASGSPIVEIPRRERRKTVTFDERCDVVEFDRESCEDAVFDTDDEEVYGRPEPQQGQSLEMSAEAFEYFDAVALDDSINGLVDSMLQEQEVTSLSEPSTPETNTASLSSIATDADLMTGGAEDGIPLGRTHHAERVRAHHHEVIDMHLPLPAAFSSKDPSFSTPSRREQADPQTPRALGTPTNTSYGMLPMPSLPSDTERAEGGIPLGRTHHADRARAAHESGEDLDVKMLPPSPSPTKNVTRPSFEHELSDSLLPKFDLGLDDIQTSSPKAAITGSKPSNDDVFGSNFESENALGELEYEHADIDVELLSNTSIASFHEFPPLEGAEYDEAVKDDDHHRSRDISFGGRSDRSLDAIVSGLQLREEPNENGAQLGAGQEADEERMETDETAEPEAQATHEPHEASEPARGVSPALNRSQDMGTRSPRGLGLYSQQDVGSSGSLAESDGRLSRSPHVTRQDALLRLSQQQSSESFRPLEPLQLASSVTSMPKVEEQEDDKIDMDVLAKLPPTPSEVDKPHSRPSLGERLKRALSPALAAPAPVRPSDMTSTSPAPPSSAAPLRTASSSHPPVQNTSSFSPCETSPIPSPPRVGQHGRALTYDFDERPPSAPAKIVAPRSPVSSTFDFNRPGVDIGEMDMRSALERLVDDVSIAGGVEPSPAVKNGLSNAEVDRSGATISDGDVSMADTELITEESTDLLASLRDDMRDRPQLQRAGTAPLPALPSTSTPERPPMSRSVSEVSMMGGTSAAAPFQEAAHAASHAGPVDTYPTSSTPPPLPPKTPEKSARQVREEMIRERRREARARESGEYFVPPRRDASGNLLEESPASRRKSAQRPSMTRSMSTGDAEEMKVEAPTTQRQVSVLRRRRGGVLGMALGDEEDGLSDSIERELRKRDDPKKKSYELIERDAGVYASSSQEESVVHMSQSLEVEDKAWRPVRRPSDMNEYAREIKEIRAQEKPGKSHGKVFVKVLRIKSLSVPMPPQLTMFTCTLNNGIHYVTTPECRLSREAKIEQEFELIEHTRLEFTLTLHIRRDPHILQQLKVIQPPAMPPTPQPAPSSPSQHRGVRSFFGGTPKKPKPSKHVRAQTEPLVRFEMQENLARYMKQDGTLGRAFIAFKDIARHCDTRLFETAFPLIGQRLEAPGEGGGAGGTMIPKQVGEIILQIFRLPPLPGIPPNQLPQSLDECHRGLRHINWHKVTYHEGVLTQLGADCSTWRRRQLRVIGGSLVAFNDVTKRATATIDLKKAIAIEDDQDPKNVARRRDVDDFDAMYGVERSFRLIFPHNQEIMFFADTDEEKAKWLEVFRALVGRIPPHPLWAELLWQKLGEASKASSHQGFSAAASNPNGARMRQ